MRSVSYNDKNERGKAIGYNVPAQGPGRVFLFRRGGALNYWIKYTKTIYICSAGAGRSFERNNICYFANSLLL